MGEDEERVIARRSAAGTLWHRRSEDVTRAFVLAVAVAIVIGMLMMLCVLCVYVRTGKKVLSSPWSRASDL